MTCIIVIVTMKPSIKLMLSQLYLYQACITAYHRVPTFVGLFINVTFVAGTVIAIIA